MQNQRSPKPLTRSTFSFLQNANHALPFPHMQIVVQRLHLLRHHLSPVLYLSATHKHSVSKNSIFEAPLFDYIFSPKEYSSKTFFSLTTSPLPNADLWVSPRKKKHTHKHSIFEAPPFDYIFSPKEYSSKTFFSLITSPLPNADLWVSPRKKNIPINILFLNILFLKPHRLIISSALKNTHPKPSSL